MFFQTCDTYWLFFEVILELIHHQLQLDAIFSGCEQLFHFFFAFFAFWDSGINSTFKLSVFHVQLVNMLKLCESVGWI